MKKWYNVEFSQSTKSMIKRVNDFREWLYDNGMCGRCKNMHEKE